MVTIGHRASGRNEDATWNEPPYRLESGKWHMMWILIHLRKLAMPMRHTVPSSRRTSLLEGQEAEIRVEAMRKAVAVGIADIEAGRFQEFGTAEALREGLSSLVRETLGSATSAEDRP